MSCEFDKEQLRMYSLQCLDVSEAETVKQHLEHCQDCETDLIGFKNTTTVFSEAFDEEAPDWLLTRTMANVRARSKRRFAWGIPVIAGSTVLLLVLVFSFNVHRSFITAPSSLRQVHNETELQEAQYKDEIGIQETLLNDLLVGDIEGDNENPVDDRSIYESLDVAPEVAKLLL